MQIVRSTSIINHQMILGSHYSGRYWACVYWSSRQAELCCLKYQCK